MSRSARVESIWGERVVVLALKMGGIEELEFETRKSVFEHRLDVFEHKMTASHIRLAFRLGLEGGGMPVNDALEMVQAYCQPGNLEKVRFNVANMLHAAIEGVDEEIDLQADEQLAGKTPGQGSTPTKPSQTDA
ncbi:MAG: GTA-gp10 family protein [Henriciella sp.]|nr:GTA-gp10 family protein [Henriciella sp.]